MNKHHRLALWLASRKRDYRQGVQLFAELNIDTGKLPFLNSGQSRIHRSLLYRALENYARVRGIKPLKGDSVKKSVRGTALSRSEKSRPGKTVSVEKNTLERPLVDTNPSVRFDELPPDLQEKFKTNARLSRQIRTLHAELKASIDLKDGETRRSELAREFLNKQNLAGKRGQP